MSANVIGNKILAGLMREFEKDFGLKESSKSKSFERFVNYIVLSKIDPDSFSDPAAFDLVDVDKEGTFGIDAFALFINDSIILEKSDIEVHRKLKRMDVRFVFIQSKTSQSIDSGEILKFTAAVRNIFSPKPGIPLSDDINIAKGLIDEVFQYENAKFFAGRKPQCDLYFINAGAEIKDKNGIILDRNLRGIFENEKNNLEESIREFKSVNIHHMGADSLIDSYNEIENRYSVKINFDRSLPCVKMNDVEQAFIGYLDVSEFLKIITGSDGAIRKNIFYENVRDFQGLENSVNTEIASTLTDSSVIDKFVLLNNGVTVVAGNFSNIRSTEYEISDYFIVNGCQTSNVIFKFREKIKNMQNLHVPIKFIHTTNNDLVAKLIRSTNRQTPVPDEAFVSLEKFHKRLQEFYRLHTNNLSEPLYYERRSKEFINTDKIIEKNRIVNLHSQIRSFTSVMLGEPHLVMSQNPSSILKEHRDKIFCDDHRHIPYYLSSLFVFIFNSHTNNGLIDRKYVSSRYWICWIARIICSKKISIGNFNSVQTEKDCEKIVAWLSEGNNSKVLMEHSVEVFNNAKIEYFTKNSINDSSVKINNDVVRLRAFRDSVRFHLSQRINEIG